MSEYEGVFATKLKVKVDAGIKKKKKKKSKEQEKKTMKAIVEEQSKIQLQEVATTSGINKKKSELKMTNAQLAFLKQQEKLQTKRILEKAQMTHKQRVEEFNRKLDGLTEHFDIPKVSWTK